MKAGQARYQYRDFKALLLRGSPSPPKPRNAQDLPRASAGSRADHAGTATGAASDSDSGAAPSSACPAAAIAIASVSAKI